MKTWIRQQLAEDPWGLRRSLAPGVALPLAAIALVSLLFVRTYPLNIAAYDGPNYLRMVLARESNLIHASGGPYILGTLMRLIGSLPHPDQYTPKFLFKLLIVQHCLHIVLITLSSFLCARCFGPVAAAVMTLAWGTSIFFMSNVSSTTPEWLQGEFIVVALLFCCAAFLANNSAKKLFSYLLGSCFFACAYLIKFNSGPLFLLAFALISLEPASWRLKSVRGSSCVAAFLMIIALYIGLFHYPRTKSTSLSYDHAWVLVPVVSANKSNFDIPGSLSAMRWRALSGVIPQSYDKAGAYRNIDDIAPLEVRNEYKAFYDEVMSMSLGELNSFVLKNPLPDGFIGHLSPIPIYYFVGLKEADDLGIRVYLDYVASDPVGYAAKVLYSFVNVTPADVSYATVPLPGNMLKLERDGLLENSNSRLVGTDSWFAHVYWSPQLVVWEPGLKLAGWMNTYLSGGRVAQFALILLVLTQLVIRPPGTQKKMFLVISCGVLMFVLQCHALFLMRVKEAITIWPLTSLLWGVSVGYLFDRVNLKSNHGLHSLS